MGDRCDARPASSSQNSLCTLQLLNARTRPVLHRPPDELNCLNALWLVVPPARSRSCAWPSWEAPWLI